LAQLGLILGRKIYHLGDNPYIQRHRRILQHLHLALFLNAIKQLSDSRLNALAPAFLGIRREVGVYHTKLAEAKAEDVINHLDKGCSVRATARLVQVCKETVARLLRVSGRHAERFRPVLGR
jgi:hypothetical protein